MYEHKSDEVIRKWRKLYGGEPNNLYSSPFIIRMIRVRRMELAKHVARIGR
jgi:hypothetical protein